MKHILLIGGSTGIGKALAEELLQKGHKVTMASRNSLDIDHSYFKHLTFDVLTSDASELSNVGALDGFSYLPGSIALKPLQMLKEEQFKSDMEINFFGLVRCVKSISSQLSEGAIQFTLHFGAFSAANDLVKPSTAAFAAAIEL
jgi:3-oxoacyl-[acyl-carrier protein] reductase